MQGWGRERVLLLDVRLRCGVLVHGEWGIAEAVGCGAVKMVMAMAM